jgi:transposase
VRNNEGRVIARSTFETTRHAIISFLASQPGELWVTFEEGTHAHWLYDVIQPRVYQVVVCDPRKSKQHGNKSDRIDADRLSELLRNGSLSPVYHGDKSTRTIQELGRSYERLTQDTVRLKNRVKAIYRSRGIEYEGADVFDPGQRAEWLKKVKEPGAQRRTERLLRELEAIEPLREEAGQELIIEGRKHAATKILRTIPGIGELRAALLLAIVMTPFRFRTKRQLWTYAGLALVTRSSADYTIVQGEVHRSRKAPLVLGLNFNCNRTLKELFKGAAVTAATRGAFRPYYEKRIQQGAAPNLVTLTIARKIASVTLVLWKKGEQYDPKKHGLEQNEPTE